MTTTVVNNSLFRSLFKIQKLTGNNFLEWYRNLRIVLSTEDKLPFLEQPIPVLPISPQRQANPPDVITTHQAWVKAQKKDLEKSKKPHKATKGNQGKDKPKMGYAPVQAPPFAPKPKNPPTPKNDNLAKDAICHQCGEVGHGRRNCPIYLSELMKKKKLSQGASTSGIFTIKLYSFPSTSWVYDTGCGTHICITTQGLRGSSKLKPGALNLYVDDGHRAAVKAIGDFHLCLPSGLVLILHNCNYAPSITRGIISVSRLYKDGFVNRFEDDNSISVFKNNMIYFKAIPQDDIYEIVMSSSNTNECSMYAVTNKRSKLNFDSAHLWHFRLGHINKKHIEKLQHDGLLDSTDIESFKKCVACMSVFQKEVENQLGKTIKSLCSDRGGEYISQQFLDHLKDHGIIAYRTPPYTPQHNGVSKRRNITLLNMVRSMMSQTTLPKSFWDYAIDSAARILNMVPTKKVDKTPYEVWHGYPKETIGYSFYYLPKNKVFVARNAEFFENEVINHEAKDDQEINKPQSDINPVCRSTSTRRAPNRMCLYIDAEEHELGDLGEPAKYKVALLDPESDKWLNALNVKMQSMKDNEV
ncbi:zinc finger, CCHC-type containing protein [Tanacetum coccineum]